MFKKRISSGLTDLAILGLALGAIRCAQQNSVQATASPIPATATIVPATVTPVPVTPTLTLPTATSLPPVATSVPAKVIDLTKDQIETLDLGVTDSDFQGLFGSLTDGKYGYFIAKPNLPAFGITGLDSGKVARVDLQAFNTSKVTILDLAQSDPKLKDVAGGFTVGQYAYFVPAVNGLVARVDLQNFTNGGVTTLNLAAVDNSLVGYFPGGFSDGQFAYLIPPLADGSGHPSGKVVRVDLQDFTTHGVTVLDLTKVEEDLVGFGCGFTDGHYAYFMPDARYNGAKTKEVRVELQDFTPHGVTLLDLVKIDSRSVDGEVCFTDGHYGYRMSETHLFMTREDLSNFTPGGETILDLGRSASNVLGAVAGFINESFGYFDLLDTNYSPTGRVARVDLQSFTPDGVTILNFEAADSRLGYLFDGFTDGQYLYFESLETGMVVRIKPGAIPPA